MSSVQEFNPDLLLLAIVTTKVKKSQSVNPEKSGRFHPQIQQIWASLTLGHFCDHARK
jgi:hypothetical protein